MTEKASAEIRTAPRRPPEKGPTETAPEGTGTGYPRDTANIATLRCVAMPEGNARGKVTRRPFNWLERRKACFRKTRSGVHQPRKPRARKLLQLLRQITLDDLT